DRLAIAPDGDPSRLGSRALILDPERDRLRLPDDAEARRGYQGHTAVAFVPPPSDQRMHWRAEAQRGDFRRHVMHAPIGDEYRARDPVRRNIGERRTECIEQPCAVGLAVGLTGFDETNFKPGDAAESFCNLCARGFSLRRAVAEALA